MRRAKQMGIDAFSLNLGTEDYPEQQLELAYQSAADNSMKVFISVDFAWFSTDDASRVGQLIAKFASRPAQLRVGNRVFATSYLGDGLDCQAMKAAAGIDIFWAPNFHPAMTKDHDGVDTAAI